MKCLTALCSHHEAKRLSQNVCNAPFLWESCESKSFLVMNQYFPLPWFPPVMHLCGQGRWLGQQEDPTRGSYSEFLLSGEEGTAWMEENVAGIDRFVDRHCFFCDCYCFVSRLPVITMETMDTFDLFPHNIHQDHNDWIEKEDPWLQTILPLSFKTVYVGFELQLLSFHLSNMFLNRGFRHLPPCYPNDPSWLRLSAGNAGVAV